ncbi:serine/threonine-protein phosphatase 2A activator [Lucilia cuprina]|uniref:serine/threonine-protein phosphatase 2A activator n=1 Tax=Lucilia cuprina TaxID=7375 RepID=UPI001F055EC7|nr:serine/threonine-protein phosphatase 2A activator [Lucilia cuprina]
MDMLVQEPKNIPLELAGAAQPEKKVKQLSDVQVWLRSEAYYDLVGFINGISTAIQGKKLNDQIYISPTMKNLIEIFDKLNSFINETPPIEQPQRFGNKAFRAWSRKMNHEIFQILLKSIPADKCHLVTELGFYLSESFGNSVRIDYGTGHELSFIFFLCALFKGEILKEEDNIASALVLFNTYLTFVRRLQKTYRMEPAGSQGVWSLDDYQFVPFIWGSAQLSFGSPFPPAKFLDEDIIDSYKSEYMYISCIDFIQQVKTGHFSEHSYQLWSISAVPSWSKINAGLVKMYQKEILSKFPIIQHVYFGNLMSFNSVKPGTTIASARLGFLHPATVTEAKKPTIGSNLKVVDQENSTTSSTEPDSINNKQRVMINVQSSQSTKETAE